MTSIASANDTALPSVMPMIGHEMPRRGILAGLTTLPLIGGGLALLGKPTGVAQPVTTELLEAYKTWLDMEHRFLSWDMAKDARFQQGFYRNSASSDTPHGLWSVIQRSHFYYGSSGSYHDGTPATSPYKRAALVLSAVGCDWQGGM